MDYLRLAFKDKKIEDQYEKTYLAK